MNFKLSSIKTNKIIKGTLILTLASVLTRIIGFLFRIFLTRQISAEGLGIIQLIFPIQIILCSLCSLGIQQAIAKLSSETSKDNPDLPLIYLINGIMISITISIITAIIIYLSSDYIGIYFLKENRCTPLIKILALYLPFSSIHFCIFGYSLSHFNTVLPAISQIIEQITRVISIITFMLFCKFTGHCLTLNMVMYGTGIGEISATVYSVKKMKAIIKKNNLLNTVSFLNNPSKIIALKHINRIINYGLPITLNRLLSSILASIENSLIPSMLMVYGLSKETSLSTYGILSGLVIPFILFPGAIVNSFSQLILPAISKAASNDNEEQIKKTTKASISFSIIFGVFCSTIFFNYGNLIGKYLLSDANSGKYIALIGYICPFIYISSTITSIINGLGKTTTVFLINIFTTILQITMIIFFIPKYGIYGFIDSFLIGNIANSLILFLYIKKRVTLSYNTILLFSTCSLLSFIYMHFSEIFLNYLNINNLLISIIQCTIYIILYTSIYLKFNQLNLYQKE